MVSLPIFEWVITPLSPAVIVIHLGVLEPAPALIVRVQSHPPGEVLVVKLFPVEDALSVHHLELVSGDDFEALLWSQFNIIIVFPSFADIKTDCGSLFNLCHDLGRLLAGCVDHPVEGGHGSECRFLHLVVLLVIESLVKFEFKSLRAI